MGERQASGAPPSGAVATAERGPARPFDTGPVPSRYRPELDGLRAIAALLVLAFHAGMGSAVGGYIGVDVFFVLSGFLITGLLYDAAGGGARALLSFYARRVRRLLPAALVVLVCTAAIWTAVAGSVEREPIVGDVRSAALYFSNWHFAAQATDYFAATDAPSPVIHFWSLSAEEQFYLVWPAVMMLVLAVCGAGRRRGRLCLSGLALLLAAASLVSLVEATRQGSERGYFGTDCRAYQLLAGALVALWAKGRAESSHRRRPSTVPHVVQVVALAGLLVAATSAVTLGSAGRGALAAGCTVVLLWALVLRPRGAAGRVLSWSVPAYLGRISYSTYLWHWPVILLIRRFVVISPHYLFIAATGLSVGLASASYRLLEHPIRQAPSLSRHPRAVLAAGLAASLAMGLTVAPRLLGSDRHPVVVPISTLSAGDAPIGPVPPAVRTATANLPKPAKHTPVPSGQALHDAGKAHVKRTCLQTIARLGCLAHQGGGPKVLVVGDSHLETLFPVFDDLAAKYDLTLYTWMYYVCPWQRGVLPQGTNEDPCQTNKAELYDTMLPTVRPDVVITVNRGYDDPNYPRPLVAAGHPDQTDPAVVLRKATPAAVGAVLANAKRLVELEPWPSMPFNARSCLAGVKYDEQCRAKSGGKAPSEKAIEAVAAHDERVTAIDLDHDVCPHLPVCDAVVDGIITRIDNDHLTAAYAKALEPALDKRLAAAGVFE